MLSVGMVGDVRIDAAEEMGSLLAMLLRMLGTETLERVRKGQRGGTSGAIELGVGVLLRSLLGRGVSISSSIGSGRAGGVTGVVLVTRPVATGVVFGLDKGDFLSRPFLSLPLPKTAFRSDPFRFRGGLVCVSSVTLLLNGDLEGLGGPVSVVSPSPVRRTFKREKRFPDIERL